MMQTSEAQQKLDIIIVGCGLGGLAAAYTLGKAGHKVMVLEAATELGEIGAGIQLAPSMFFYPRDIFERKLSLLMADVSRLLIRWGLKGKLDSQGVKPEYISFRRCMC